MPTLYAAESIEAALSETLFHTVPVGGTERRVGRSRLVPWLISRLTPVRELRLVDLRDDALPALELTREELIESPASSYPATAKWASALFHSQPESDGLIWNSRQAREQLSLVLFARGRVVRKDLGIAAPPLSMAVGRGRDMVETAAEKLEITLVA